MKVHGLGYLPPAANAMVKFPIEILVIHFRTSQQSGPCRFCPFEWRNIMINHEFTAESLKLQAKRLRNYLTTKDIDLSHSTILEALAHQYGYRDWNVLSSKLAEPCWPSVGERVTGTYLGHHFNGIVRSVHITKNEGIRRFHFQFDKPVDVVKSEHFSNFRKRVSADLNKTLRSVNSKGEIDDILVLSN